MKEYNGRLVKHIQGCCLGDTPNDNRFCYVNELPVYVLYQSDDGKDVIVTDFSEICNSVLDGNSIKANSLPRNFDLRGTKQVGKSKLFYVVLNNRQDKLSIRPSSTAGKTLTNPSRNHLDDASDLQQLLCHQGILIMAKLYINIALDGVYGELISWKPLNWSHLQSKQSTEFIERYYHHADKHIFKLSKSHYAIEEPASCRDHSVTPKIKQESPLVGAQLLFHNVDEEDSQAPLFPPTQASDEEFPTQHHQRNLSDIGEEQAENDIGQKPPENEGAFAPTSTSNHTPPQLPGHLQLIETITIQRLLQLSIPRELEKGQIYLISGKIKGYIPYHPFIIKPYKRTVKLANFKLVLQQHNHQETNHQMFLEFHQESQICQFLNLHEPEEVVENFDKINTKFNRLLHNDNMVDIKVKLYSKHSNKRVYPYWGCISTIDELIDQ
jgi:hypothetical protein